jgi:STAS-like domain of unknown function (DUF4325)
MEVTQKIIIAKDFSDALGARYRKDGPFSGEEFLETLLLPKFESAVKSNSLLLIDLNNVYGYPSSFVSGSFGKLSIEKTKDLVLKHIKFDSTSNPLNEEKIIREIKEPKRVPA